MTGLNLGERLLFDNLDLTSPEAVINDLIAMIKSETRGIVIGVISKYEGEIEPYKKIIRTPMPGLTAFAQAVSSPLQPKEEIVEVDIQSNLGKEGDPIEKFEFYLGTPAFEQYKYRICFLQHGAANYPVKVVLEQSIADEINKQGKNSNCVYVKSNKDELDALIREIISSKTVIDVMQELINIHFINQAQQ